MILKLEGGTDNARKTEKQELVKGHHSQNT